MQNSHDLRLTPRSFQADLLLAVGIAVLVAVLGRGGDLLCIRLGWGDPFAHWLDDGLTGAVSGALALVVLRNHSAKRVELGRRMHIIREMNHNVRNALEVIHSANYAPLERDRRIEMIDHAARRIEEALRNFTT